MKNISVNIVIRNEAKRLPRLLNTLRDFDDIVVVDQESTDNSVEICEKYGCRVLHDKASGFAETSRQLAMDTSKDEWILTLDADEFLTTRFYEDMDDFIKMDIDCVLCCRAFIRTPNGADDITDEVIANISTNIPFEHSSEAFCCRLYKKNSVEILKKLHHKIMPKHLSLCLHCYYNAIVEFKSPTEHEIDHIRYKAIIENNYDAKIHI